MTNILFPNGRKGWTSVLQLQNGSGIAEIHAQLKLRAGMSIDVFLGKSQERPPRLFWKEGKRGQETNTYQILTKSSSIFSP